MFPQSLIPFVIIMIPVAIVGLYMKFSADRDERRNGRP